MKARSAPMYICGTIAILSGIVNILTWLMIEIRDNDLFPIAIRTLAVLVMLLYFPITLQSQSGLSWVRISAMCLPLAGLAILSSIYCALTNETYIGPVLIAMMLLLFIAIGMQFWGMWGRAGAMRYVPAAVLMAVYTTFGVPILQIPFPASLYAAVTVFPLFSLYIVLDLLSIRKGIISS